MLEGAVAQEPPPVQCVSRLCCRDVQLTAVAEKQLSTAAEAQNHMAVHVSRMTRNNSTQCIEQTLDFTYQATAVCGQEYRIGEHVV